MKKHENNKLENQIENEARNRQAVLLASKKAKRVRILAALSVFICMVLVLSATIIANHERLSRGPNLIVTEAVTADNSWFTTNTNGGTAANPFVINTLGQLSSMRNMVNANQNSMAAANRHFHLGASFDMSGVNWVPIGTAANPFRGIFNGNNHVLSGLTINTAAANFVGLFGFVQGARSGTNITSGIFRNIILTDVNINMTTANRSHIGALVGGASVTYLIEDVYISITRFNALLNSENVGGVIGAANGVRGVDGAIIRRVGVTGGTIAANAKHVGGVIGLSDGVLIQQAFTTVNVSAEGIAGRNGASTRKWINAGGITGSPTGNATIIEDSFTTGNITATGNFQHTVAGGIAGETDVGPTAGVHGNRHTIRRSYTTSAVHVHNDGASFWMGAIAGEWAIANSFIYRSVALNRSLTRTGSGGGNHTGIMGGNANNSAWPQGTLNRALTGLAGTGVVLNPTWPAASANNANNVGRLAAAQFQNNPATFSAIGWDINNNPNGTSIWFTQAGLNNGHPVLRSMMRFMPGAPGHTAPLTISYQANGGTGAITAGANPQIVRRIGTGSARVSLQDRGTNFVRPGFIFGGWNTSPNGTGTNHLPFDILTINTNLRLYATWGWTITYHANGATSDNSTFPEAQMVTGNRNATVVGQGQMYKLNHIFIGWNTAQDGSGEWFYAGNYINNYGNGNITLFAQWTPLLQVNFEYFGGVHADGSPNWTAMQVFYSQTYGTIPVTNQPRLLPSNVIRTGYIFGGWALEMEVNEFHGGTGVGEPITEDTIVAQRGSHELYAIWIPIQVTVNFDTRGATPWLIPSRTVTFREPYGELKQGVTSQSSIGNPDLLHRDGFGFRGWFSGLEGTGEHITELSVVNNHLTHTLFAHWERYVDHRIWFHDHLGHMRESVIVNQFDLSYGHCVIPHTMFMQALRPYSIITGWHFTFRLERVTIAVNGQINLSHFSTGVFELFLRSDWLSPTDMMRIELFDSDGTLISPRRLLLPASNFSPNPFQAANLYSFALGQGIDCFLNGRVLSGWYTMTDGVRMNQIGIEDFDNDGVIRLRARFVGEAAPDEEFIIFLSDQYSNILTVITLRGYQLPYDLNQHLDLIPDGNIFIGWNVNGRIAQNALIRLTDFANNPGGVVGSNIIVVNAMYESDATNPAFFIHFFNPYEIHPTIQITLNEWETTFAAGFNDFPIPQDQEFLTFIGWSLNGLPVNNITLDTFGQDNRIIELRANWHSQTVYTIILTVRGAQFGETIRLTANRLEGDGFSLSSFIPLNEGFLGWTLDGNTVIDRIVLSDFSLDANGMYILTVAAMWDAEYTINFESRGSMFSITIMGRQLSPTPFDLTPHMPSAPGFVSWAINLTNHVSELTLADFGGNFAITLTAIWEPEFNIILTSQGQTVASVVLAQSQLVVPYQLAPHFMGGTFLHWEHNGVVFNEVPLAFFVTNDTNTITLTAVFDDILTLNFFSRGNVFAVVSLSRTQFMSLGVAGYNLANNSMHWINDINFGGWSIDGLNPVSNLSITDFGNGTLITLVAIWLNTYTINFVSMGVPLAPIVLTFAYLSAGDFDLSTTLINEAGFLGWTLDGVNIASFISLSDFGGGIMITLVAVWEDAFSIIFVSNGLRHTEENLVLSDFDGDGNFVFGAHDLGEGFVGWSLDGVAIIEYININDFSLAGQLTLVAVWETEFSIIFESNEMGYTVAHITRSRLENYGFDLSPYIVPNIRFKGWSLDGINLVANNIITISDFGSNTVLTVSALWVAEYTIQMMSREIIFATVVLTILELEALGALGYNLAPHTPNASGFIGWTHDGLTPITSISHADFNGERVITLLALWEQTYTINFATGDPSWTIAPVLLTLSQLLNNGNGFDLTSFSTLEPGFVGWLLRDVGIVDVLDLTHFGTNTAITLTAIWDTERSIVLWDGTTHLLTITGLLSDDLMNAPHMLTQYNIDDAAFIGWSIDRINIITYVSLLDFGINEVLNIFAVWQDEFVVRLFNGANLHAEIVFLTSELIELAMQGYTLTAYNIPNAAFLGWSTNGETDGIIGAIFLSSFLDGQFSLNLSAVWDEEFVITFISDGVLFGQPVIITYSQFNLLANGRYSLLGHSPTLLNFIGWTIGDGIIDYVTMDDFINNVLTITAVWDAVYTIIFESRGTQFGNPVTIMARALLEYGFDFEDVIINAPGFLGWSVNGVLRPINRVDIIDFVGTTLVITAVWDIEYTITFMSNGQVVGAPLTILRQNLLTPYSLTPHNISAAGQTFLGWTLDGSRLLEEVDLSTFGLGLSITLIAVWETEYIINFVGQAGRFISTQTIILASELFMQGFSYVIGHTIADADFIGWTLDGFSVVTYIIPAHFGHLTVLHLYILWNDEFVIEYMDAGSVIRTVTLDRRFLMEQDYVIATNILGVSDQVDFIGFSIDGINVASVVSLSDFGDNLQLVLSIIWEADYTLVFMIDGAALTTAVSRRTLTHEGYILSELLAFVHAIDIESDRFFIGWRVGDADDIVYSINISHFGTNVVLTAIAVFDAEYTIVFANLRGNVLANVVLPRLELEAAVFGLIDLNLGGDFIGWSIDGGISLVDEIALSDFAAGTILTVSAVWDEMLTIFISSRTNVLFETHQVISRSRLVEDGGYWLGRHNFGEQGFLGFSVNGNITNTVVLADFNGFSFVTAVAVWEENFVINFIGRGGRIEQTISIAASSAIAGFSLANFSIDNVAFRGWSFGGEFISMINFNHFDSSSTINITALWYREFIINLIYSTGIVSISVYENQLAHSNYSLVPHNHNTAGFVGWIMQDGQTFRTYITMLDFEYANSITLTAIYEEQYAILFMSGGQNVMMPILIYSSSLIAGYPVGNHRLADAGFIGWSINGVDIIDTLNLSHFAGNTTRIISLVAVFEPTFNVHMFNDGNHFAVITLSLNQLLNGDFVLPAIVDESGYDRVFEGWYLDGQPIAGNIITLDMFNSSIGGELWVTARWAGLYELYLIDSSGDRIGHFVFSNVQIDDMGVFVLADLDDEDTRAFMGWYINNIRVNAVTGTHFLDNNNIVVAVARWLDVFPTYLINLYRDDGSLITSIGGIRYRDLPFDLSAFDAYVRVQGRVFLGWNVGGRRLPLDSPMIMFEDFAGFNIVMVVAEYESLDSVSHYTVIYTDSDGRLLSAVLVAFVDFPYTLTIPNASVANGRTFIGWFVRGVMTTTLTTNDIVPGEAIIVVARWIDPSGYTLNVYTETGALIESIVLYAEELPFALPSDFGSNDYRTFIGWFTHDNRRIEVVSLLDFAGFNLLSIWARFEYHAPRIHTLRVWDGDPRIMDVAAGEAVMLWIAPMSGHIQTGISFFMGSSVYNWVQFDAEWVSTVDGGGHWVFIMPDEDVWVLVDFDGREHFMLVYHDGFSEHHVDFIFNGQFVLPVDEPVRVGYNFVGWFLGNSHTPWETSVEADFDAIYDYLVQVHIGGGEFIYVLTVMAKWDLVVEYADYYRVTFIFNNGTGQFMHAPIERNTTINDWIFYQSFPAPAPPLGYRFSHWFLLGSDPSIPFDYAEKITRSITLVAYFVEDDEVGFIMIDTEAGNSFRIVYAELCEETWIYIYTTVDQSNYRVDGLGNRLPVFLVNVPLELEVWLFMRQFSNNPDRLSLWNADASEMVCEYEFVGTGMRLKLKDENGNVIDEFIVVVRGDLDGNGFVSIADGIYLNNFLAGRIDLTTAQFLAADIDFNGVVSIADRTAFNNHLAGRIDLSEEYHIVQHDDNDDN